MIQEIIIDMIPATAKALEAYGFYIGERTTDKKLTIPFYAHVEEGINIPFEYNNNVVLRTARIHPTESPIIWLERHMLTTQFFIGLGSTPFALLLGLPTHTISTNPSLPNIDNVKCFLFKAGTGCILKKGTWHDFPIAIDSPVTCLTGNSSEVVDALTSIKTPQEMNYGDIYKINLIKKFNLQLKVKNDT